MIIITGSGRAGTSITAKLFDQLGFDLGANNRWFDKYRAGYEPLGIVRLNEAIIASGVWGRAYTPPARREALAGQFRQRMHELATRLQVAKDPRFAVTLDLWLRAGVPIDYVVVCIRNPEECIESAVETGAGFALEGPESMLRGYHELTARIGRLFETLALSGTPFGLLRYDHYIEDFLRLGVPLPHNAEEVLRAGFQPSERIVTEAAWASDEETLDRLGQQYPCSFPSKPEPAEGVQHDFERVVNWIHPHAPRLPRYEVHLPESRLASIEVALDNEQPVEAILQAAWLEDGGGERTDLLDEARSRIVLNDGRWVREVAGGSLIQFSNAAASVQCKLLSLHEHAAPARLYLSLLTAAGAPANAAAIDLAGGRTPLVVEEMDDGSQ